MAQNIQGFRAKEVKVAGDFHNTTNVNLPAQAPAPVTSFRNVIAPIKSFQGRETLMEEIHKMFTERSDKHDLLDRILAMVGFGGMGKTELARKFVDVYKESYPNVASINAESRLSIRKSFIELAEILKLPINDVQDGTKVVEQVYKHVGEHVTSPLFIFDNANRLNTNDSGFDIFEYLPKMKYLNQPLFLITTRTTEWEADNVATLEVEELTKDESVRFLRARFQLAHADPSKEDRKRKELDLLIDELYDCIQGYPLALQLAAANVSFKPKTDGPKLLHIRLKNFITKVRELQDSVMTGCVKRAGTDYERTFEIVWNITIEEIERDEHSSVGRHLLWILGYTDPDGAPCKEIQEVFEAHLPDERDTTEDEEFEEALSLLKKLVLVHTCEDYKADLATRMHRMVQSFARRDDEKAIGLQYIMKKKNTKLARHYFNSLPKLAIPRAVLGNDQLVVAWLRCFIELAIPVHDNLNGPELLFDVTHEQQLKIRNCIYVDEIRATVELVRNLQSVEWDFYDNSDALASGIIAYAKTITIGSPLTDFLLELALELLRKRVVFRMKESAFLILKEWLLHPDTVFPPSFYQDGAQLQLLVFDAIKYSEANKWESGELRRLLYKDFESILKDCQWINEPVPFIGLYVGLNMEETIEKILREPQEMELSLVFVRNDAFKDKKSTERLLAMNNISLKLRRYLQALQAELASKWEMISAAGTAISGNRNPSSALQMTAREVAWQFLPNEFKDDTSKIASHIYMGYIISYSIALYDYDLNGGSFYEMLEKWLPSCEYLITISVLTELPRECKFRVTLWLYASRWNLDDDTLVLNRTLRKIREQKGPEPILLVFQQVVVEALQLLNSVYKNCWNE